ncbi:MAG: DUF4079 family protein [Syntrophales bacterium]|nr:DUF4079 family protein [Syntrophales bacterium]
MSDKQFLLYLKLAHGMFNSSMMLLFLYQGWLGLAIRRARKTGAPVPLAAARRHRKTGPVLVMLGIMGFVAGVILILLDKGRALEYPLHFLNGLTIALLLSATYLVSRRIKGPDSPFRDPHFGLGLLLVSLYIIQLALGLGILL